MFPSSFLRRGLLSLMLAMACAAAAAAEDLVYLSPAASGSGPRKLSGTIVEYTGRELRLKPAAGRERTIPAEQVERVETKLCAEQQAADEFLAQGDFRSAVARYRLALEGDREVRPWVRRQILSQTVWCYRNLAEWEQAGEFFLALIERDPQTQYFDCIPLAWTALQPSPAVVQKAREWLSKRDNSAATLLGASLLLTGNQRTTATNYLKQLATDKDPRIAWLAQTQLWRTTAPQASEEQLVAWSRQLAESPPTLRTGAYYVLGSALAGTQPREAALAFMRLPIMDPRDRNLTAAALLLAGGCLEKLGQRGEAAGLYRELVAGYGHLPEVGEARRRLQNLAGGGSGT